MDSAVLMSSRNNNLTRLKALLANRFLLGLCVLTTLVFAQESTFAQELKQEVVQAKAEVPANEVAQQQSPIDLTVASDGNVSQTGDILRLEETIRGNKEQPKVLSIVPWQLPLHQRIDRNEQRWAPIQTQLKPLERNSFLKEIKLIDVIQPSQSSAQVEVQSN
ncbi:MAG: hypothetical protein ACI97K_002292 [Glaciecola sp.]|jgi:hypothetical protein